MARGDRGDVLELYQNCTDKRQGELVQERIRNTEIEEMYLNVPTAQIND